MKDRIMRNSKMTFVSFNFIAHSPQFLKHEKKAKHKIQILWIGRPIIMLPRPMQMNSEDNEEYQKKKTSHQYILVMLQDDKTFQKSTNSLD